MYWRISRRQASTVIAGVNMRLVREHNERMSLAWHVAALQRAKRMPKLKTLFAKAAERKTQTWQQQMAVMDMWAVHTVRVQRALKDLNNRARSHGRK